MTSGAYDNTERGIIGLPAKPHFLAPDEVTQPTLPGMEGLTAGQAEAKRSRERAEAHGLVKPSKKHKKKARSLRDMAFETRQAAQTVMRSEMERGVHKPQRLGEVLDEVVGPQTELSEYGQFDQDVPNIALEVIDQHGEGLRTGMREWSIIQRMVEAGIRRGYAERG